MLAPCALHEMGNRYEIVVPPTEAIAPLPAWLSTYLADGGSSSDGGGPRGAIPHGAGAASLGVAPTSATGREGLLFHLFAARGWIGRQKKPGVWLAACPQENQHTIGSRFDSSTALYAPDVGQELGALHCKHAHCASLKPGDVLGFFTPHEQASARAVAGIVDKGREGFRRALALYNDGAEYEEVAADTDAETASAALARHERGRAGATIRDVGCTPYDDPNKPPLRVLRLEIVTDDGELFTNVKVGLYRGDLYPGDGDDGSQGLRLHAGEVRERKAL